MGRQAADGHADLRRAPLAHLGGPTRAGRAVGCLLGGAAGDALGAAVERLDLAEIRRRFGPDGIREPAAAYGRVGAITDDTQMTLFTAEGLLDARRGGGDPVDGVRAAYLRWRATQEPGPRPGVRGLAALPGLNARRGPGATCLTALAAGGRGTPERPANDSKGCGAVMRIAPVGLVAERPFDLAVRIGALTHGHPSGHLSAGVLAVTVAQLLAGRPLRAAIAVARDELRARPGAAETDAAIADALRLAEAGPPRPEGVERLGGGWVGEEALAIGLVCALTAEGFADGVRRAVNHGGDSDSTGAIAGTLLGTLLGAEALPQRWLATLELRDEITSLARALVA